MTTMAAPTKPSEAVQQGLCPSCLGQRIVYSIVAGRDTPCHSCGGSGTLDGVWAQTCADPDCQDHPPAIAIRLRQAEELLTEWFRWWRDSNDGPAKMPNSLHTRTATHLTISAYQDGREIIGPLDL